MPPQVDPLQELSAALSRLSTDQEKAERVVSYMQQLDAAHPAAPTSLVHNSSGGNTGGAVPHMPFSAAAFQRVLAQHGVSPFLLAAAAGDSMAPQSVLDRVPCAFVDTTVPEECPKTGVSVCGGCRLVSYCSKECQRKHWKIHARDCKDPIRSDDWQPAWVQQGRPPSFLTDKGQPTPRDHLFSLGLSLWGNMPAMNVLNLSEEAVRSRTTLNLAFVASGDLRNVIQTVNSLSEDYTGKVAIVMNDHDPHVTLRNILMLQILGTIPDKHKAADIALHFWYSAFIPTSYHSKILAIAGKLALDPANDLLDQELGPNARLQAHMDQHMRMICAAMCASSETYGFAEAADEYSRIRFESSRVDLHHRQYVKCEGSHRLALLEYRRFGLVLPFGAHNAHFNTPNRFLFSPDGYWLQNDHCTPLHSWDIEDVVKSGKAHGATREDIYGCLYFHVSDQLRAFAARLARLNIAFKVFNRDSVALAGALARNALAPRGVPQSMRFDRIEASNVVDASYLGLAPVLEAWGRFLKRTRDATFLAYFMNWPGDQAGARPDETHGDIEALMDKCIELGRITLPSKETAENMNVQQVLAMMGRSMVEYHAYDSVYDNSGAFDKYLVKYGMEPALQHWKLKRKLKHTIVPHRLCVPLGSAPSALPEFKDKEAWYLQFALACPMWSERFLEVGCA